MVWLFQITIEWKPLKCVHAEIEISFLKILFAMLSKIYLYGIPTEINIDCGRHFVLLGKNTIDQIFKIHYSLGYKLFHIPRVQNRHNLIVLIKIIYSEDFFSTSWATFYSFTSYTDWMLLMALYSLKLILWHCIQSLIIKGKQLNFTGCQKPQRSFQWLVLYGLEFKIELL